MIKYVIKIINCDKFLVKNDLLKGHLTFIWLKNRVSLRNMWKKDLLKDHLTFIWLAKHSGSVIKLNTDVGLPLEIKSLLKWKSQRWGEDFLFSRRSKNSLQWRKMWLTCSC